MKKKTNEVAGDYSMSATRRMQTPGNIRSGFPTKGSRSSLENDVESEQSFERQQKESLPKAAIAFLTKGDKILAVSRGDDMSNMNMPGGTVEPGEDPKDACVRELWEETGIKAVEIYPVFTKVHNGWLVTTFKVPVYTGSLKASWEGKPSWEKPDVLLSGAHGDYFQDMMISLRGEALKESRKV